MNDIAHTSPAKRQKDDAVAAKTAEPHGEERLTPFRELQLLEAHRRGGPGANEALCDLVRGYQRRIYSICHRMVRNTHDASDLTQDVLVKMVENLESYKGQSKLSTWVFRVALNCCMTHLRRQKQRKHETLDPADTSGGGPVIINPDRTPTGREMKDRGSREPLPTQCVEQEQTRSAVLQALSGLDGDLRAILVLRDVQELDYQQLAEVLEIPIGTVKSRLFRARAALRAAMRDK